MHKSLKNIIFIKKMKGIKKVETILLTLISIYLLVKINLSNIFLLNLAVSAGLFVTMLYLLSYLYDKTILYYAQLQKNNAQHEKEREGFFEYMKELANLHGNENGETLSQYVKDFYHVSNIDCEAFKFAVKGLSSMETQEFEYEFLQLSFNDVKKSDIFYGSIVKWQPQSLIDCLEDIHIDDNAKVILGLNNDGTTFLVESSIEIPSQLKEVLEHYCFCLFSLTSKHKGFKDRVQLHFVNKELIALIPQDDFNALDLKDQILSVRNEMDNLLK